MKKMYSFLVASLFFASIINAQSTVEIGTGATFTGTGLPVEPYYGYSYSQQIYTAAELSAAGLTAGSQIQDIRFEYNTTSLASSNTWSVSIGHTNKSSFSSSSDWESALLLEPFFSGTATVTTSTSPNQVIITGNQLGFTWDGVSNIIVAVDENSAGYGNNSQDFYARSTSGSYRALVYRSDATNPDPNFPPSASYRWAYVSNMYITATGISGGGGGGGTVSYCTANSAATCCGIAISNVSLNDLSNNTGSSSISSSGYGDYTSQSCNLYVNSTYSLAVTLGSTYTLSLHAYIDWNSDGDFDDANESYNMGTGSNSTLTQSITVPSNAASSCRMRLILSYPYNPAAFGSYCNSSNYSSYTCYLGEIEDYTIATTTQPIPVADFSASTTSTTTGTTISFTDASTNTPTSWSWNFGDGTTSTSQNPSHSYSSAGTYTVSLTATNAGGSDTETKSNYITVINSDWTWTGSAGNGDWDDGNNWDVGTAPTSSDNCIIPNGVNATISSGGSCNNLTVNATPVGFMISDDITVAGNYVDNGGTTVLLAGGKLDITGNATINKAFSVNSTSAELEVDGTLTLTAGYTTTNSGTIDCNGNLNASGHTIDQGSNGNIEISSNTTVTSFGSLDANEGTVTYGSGSSYKDNNYYNIVINSGSTFSLGQNTNYFGSLTINSSSTLALGSYNLSNWGAVDINGTLTISTGTLDVNGNFDATGGNLTFSDAGTIKIGSTITSNSTSLGTLSTDKGTIWYDGGAVTVVSDTYNNLRSSNNGTKGTSGNITVNGDHTVDANSTFAVEDNTVTVAGTSDINGTLTSDGGTYNADGTFDATGGAVTHSGSSDKLILSGSVTSLGTFTPAQGTVEYDGSGPSTTVIPGTHTSTYTGYTRGFYFQANSSFTITGLYIPTDASSGIYQSVQLVDFGTSPPASYGSTGVSFTTLFSSLQNTSNSTLTCSVSIQSGRYYGIIGGRSTAATGSIRNSYCASPTVTLGGASTTLYRCGMQGYLNSGLAASGAIWGQTTSSIGRIHILTSTDQTLFADSYNNLEIDAPSSVGGAMDVNGDLTVNASKSLDMSTYALNVAGDITNNGTLTLTGNTTTFDGSSSQTLSGSGAFTFGGLTMNASSLTLASPVTVNGVLTLTSGDISSQTDISNNGSQNFAATNVLSLGTSASVSGGSNSSHVIGAMRRSSAGTSELIFPVGNGTDFRPCYLTPSASTATTYTVEYANSAHSSITYATNGDNTTSCNTGVHHVAGACWWDIEKSSNGSSAYIAINWDNASGVDTPGDMVLTHWNSGTSKWDKITATTTGDNGSGSATASSGRIKSSSAQSDFSPFNLGSGSANNTLPIDLLSFNTTCSHNIVDVDFSVVSQVNNDYFLIERSVDAMNWEVIGQINGVEGGNSNTQMDYTFVDNNPLSNLSYYRLTQVDFDGSSKTFYPVSTTCGGSEGGLPIDVYPNPASNEVTVELELDNFQGDDVYYTITDATGKAVLSDYVQLDRGFNKHTLDIGKLPNGVYILRFNQTKDHITETRIVKR